MFTYISLASLSELKRPDAFQAQLFLIWRIALVVILVQLAAGAAAWYLEVFSDAFISFWFGGAIISFPAFVAGFSWQYVSARNSLNACKPIVTLSALCCALMTLIAWPMAILQAAPLRSAV